MLAQKILAAAALMVLIAFLIISRFPQPFASSVDDSIGKGINFLYRQQLDYGEFKMLACEDDAMTKCFFDSTPFGTAFVLYSLKDVEGEKIKEMKEKAVSFLLSEKEEGGIWRYWTSRNPKHSGIPHDLDDTSVASFALKLNGIDVNNTALILGNKNAEGWFSTWFPNPKFEDVDCVVNANVLLYLGKDDPEVCSKINKAISSNEKCAIYYPDRHPERFALFYSVSRAYENGVTCFEESKGKIVSSILSTRKSDGSFGGDSLKTALALNALLNFGYAGKEVDGGSAFLSQRQSGEGFWARGVFSDR